MLREAHGSAASSTPCCSPPEFASPLATAKLHDAVRESISGSLLLLLLLLLPRASPWPTPVCVSGRAGSAGAIPIPEFVCNTLRRFQQGHQSTPACQSDTVHGFRRLQKLECADMVDVVTTTKFRNQPAFQCATCELPDRRVPAVGRRPSMARHGRGPQVRTVEAGTQDGRLFSLIHG